MKHKYSAGRVKEYNFKRQKQCRLHKLFTKVLTSAEDRNNRSYNVYENRFAKELPDDAQKEAVAYLTENYGSEYVKGKAIQDKKECTGRP